MGSAPGTTAWRAAKYCCVNAEATYLNMPSTAGCIGCGQLYSVQASSPPYSYLTKQISLFLSSTSDCCDALENSTPSQARSSACPQSVSPQQLVLSLSVLCTRFDLTWGPIEYHRRSLDNLQTAMKHTRKLCAIMLDTLGREVRHGILLCCVRQLGC